MASTKARRKVSRPGTPVSSPPEVHNSRRNTTPVTMDAAIQTVPPLDALTHEASVYLDSPTLVTSDAIDTAPSSTDMTNTKSSREMKPRKKAREERAKRLALEQANWVRQKFDLPPSENLVASFSAALVRSILLQGRIHITTTCLCFYAKIFGRITKEMFPFESLARVKKRRGGFVANAIKIYFLNEATPPVVIGSLNHRERAFNIIQARLREINPSAAEPKDGDDGQSAGSRSNSRGSEDRSDPSDTRSIEDAELHASASTTALPQLLSTNHRSGDNLPASTLSATPSQDSTDVNIRPNSDDDGEAPVPNGPPLVWQTENDVVDKIFSSSFEKKSERTRSILHAPTKEVFNLLFVGEWLRSYHTDTSNREVTFSEWHRDSGGYMQREVNFKKPLSYKIGPKETRVNEIHRYSFTNNGGVLLEVAGHNLDAPYGDYFVCESFFELVPQGNNSTLLIISVAVAFNKSTILRGKIENTALSETKVAYEKLCRLAASALKEQVAPSRRPSNNQKRAKSIGHIPASPTKKLRCTSAAATPPKQDVPAPPVAPRTEEPTSQAQPSQGLNVGARIMESLEITDSSSVKALRIGAIAALIAVCVLLLCVLILLNKMRSDVSALEKLVAELRVAGVTRCAVESAAPNVPA